VVQSAVLLTLIDLHPVQVTASELVRQLAASPEDFGECDQIDRAIRELAGAGLLHRHDFLNRPDAIVAPTRAALFARELLTDDE
jgi:Fe2+ or Zn2+ uptake regulation protein